MRLEWWVCFWSFLLIQQCHGRCWEEERLALLQLQPSFPWLDWDKYDLKSDCCSWDESRIVCDNSTGRIRVLHMSPRIFLSRKSDDISYYLNASLFLPFQNLTDLYLSGNSISRCLKNEGFERLSSLMNLETLDLSNNLFDNRVLVSLQHLTSLRGLNLFANRFKRSILVQDINRLKSLTKLDLRHNSIESFEPSKGDEILSLPNKLEILDLCHNYFNNSVLSFLKGLSSLTYLYLGSNRLMGSINVKDINRLKSLRVLDLSSNSIESFEPLKGDEILSLPNKLEILHLSHNYFNNSVLSFLRGLSSLQILYLRSNRLTGSINLKEFTGLNNLEELYLGNNSIKGVMASKDTYGIVLKKLKTLDLSHVHAQACNILQSTALFPSLNTLYLNDNTFDDCTIRTETNGSTNLEYLHLSGSSLPSNILQAFGALPSLQGLSMKDCSISGMHQQLVDERHDLTNLEQLDLSGSSLPSNILQAFGALPSLQGLYMRNCSITGLHQQLIDGVCNFTNLWDLDISSMEASGYLPTCFSNLTALETLDISNNQFRVPSSLAPFLNLSKLRSFDASGTEIYDDHMEFNQSEPVLQLESLDLSSQLGLAGEFPKFLYHQYKLRKIHLPDTNLSGQQFPTWLLENNPYLEKIYLSDTGLSGSLALPTHPLQRLTFLAISNNLLTGDIPPDVGGLFLVLQVLDISNNQLMGNIPSSLGDLKQLVLLDLSNNKLSGGIPAQIASMSKLQEILMQNNTLQGPFPERLFNLPRLMVLDFSRNLISGTIPSTFNLPLITNIHLSSNKLHGGLPTTLCRSRYLTTLELSNNLFTDGIPRCIKELNMLSYLILRNNSIKDTIPLQMCQLTRLSVIDLSYNNFFGSIPSCLNITSHDSNDVYTFFDGIEFRTKSMSYAYSGQPFRFLIGIDLSCNKFTGEIPKEIGMLNLLGTLNLSHNSLSGVIPLMISNLKIIETLDLSFNNLGGGIPPQIVDLKLLVSFNVSFNNLSGPTPQRLFQFANFDESSYKSNPFLYGEPLSKSCKVAGPPPPADEAGNDDGFMDMGVFYISLASSYVTSLLAVLLVLWINPDWRKRWFYYVEVKATDCYYYVVDHLTKCS